MNQVVSYKTYVGDDIHMKAYSEYQKRYSRKIRESDKVLLSLVRDTLGNLQDRKRPKLLDVGCSTGNLLRHLSRAFPNLDLVGGDMVKTVIRDCRKNSDLAGIEFEEMDVVNFE